MIFPMIGHAAIPVERNHEELKNDISVVYNGLTNKNDIYVYFVQRRLTQTRWPQK